MRKLKFVGLFIAAGLLMQSAYANCTAPVMQTGGQACIGMNQNNPFSQDMYVYTCQSNGTWQKTGGGCICNGTEVASNGNVFCVGSYR